MIPEYLVSFNSNFHSVEEVDFVVVGSGVAGLRTCIELKDYKVLLVSKNGKSETSSYNAQGGIAVALNAGDSTKKHFEDTLNVGAGINNTDAVRILVEEGVERVRELIDWGLIFDKSGSKLHFTREGGHSVNRILHTGGDSTGRGLMEVLCRKIQFCKNVNLYPNFFLIDLIVSQKKVRGVLLLDKNKKLHIIKTRGVILASGGAGQIFQETTNPLAIVGDTQSTAFRKGVELTDLEFFQFHPTTFYLAGAPRFLISEAVRGEGGVLVNPAGDRFMSNYHPLGDLAPRDVVTRAILDQMETTQANCVYLDLCHLPASLIKERFPQIDAFCQLYGFDVRKDRIPVRPAAHYFMGGIRTNLWGETNIKNLYACGEVSCCGVQGANRLASNSLLESLVFGARVGRRVKEHYPAGSSPLKVSYTFPQKSDILIDREDLKRSIKSLMWRNVGIERNRETLSRAMQKLGEWEKYAFLKEFQTVSGFESQNMLILSYLMAKSALIRKESRGAHYRTDYRQTNDRKWKTHIVLKKKSYALVPEL